MHKTDALHFHHRNLGREEMEEKKWNVIYKEYRRCKITFQIPLSSESKFQKSNTTNATSHQNVMSHFKRENSQRSRFFHIFELLVSIIASRIHCRSPNPSSDGLRSRNPPILHHFAANFGKFWENSEPSSSTGCKLLFPEIPGHDLGANTTGNVVDYSTALADVQVAQRERERERESLKPGLHLVDPNLCHVAVLHGSTGYGL